MSKKKTGITVDVKKVIAKVNEKRLKKNPESKELTQGQYAINKGVSSMTFNKYSNGNAPDSLRLVSEMQKDSGLHLSDFITIEKTE